MVHLLKLGSEVLNPSCAVLGLAQPAVLELWGARGHLRARLGVPGGAPCRSRAGLSPGVGSNKHQAKPAHPQATLLSIPIPGRAGEPWEGQSSFIPAQSAPTTSRSGHYRAQTHGDGPWPWAGSHHGLGISVWGGRGPQPHVLSLEPSQLCATSS